MMRLIDKWIFFTVLIAACSKGSSPEPAPPSPPAPFTLSSAKLNGATPGAENHNTITMPVLRFNFSAPVNRSTINTGVGFKSKNGTAVAFNIQYENGDSTFLVQPSSALAFITKYNVSLNSSLKSTAGKELSGSWSLDFVTKIDSSRKFPAISDEELLTKVQQQTFKYFWDFAHPVSGLARERNNGDNNLVTSGGSGFGIMAIVVGAERGFITRSEALLRMQKIVGFLKNTAQTFHGAYPHWLNGTSGQVIPFSINDNGADLVETSYLIQGLLTARQYFNNPGASETSLRDDINTIWNKVEWSWFRRNNENTLYWHWSPDKQWQMNMPVRGWNECLITYVLAASSATYGVPKIVYDNGWASNGGMRNNNSYYGYTLPLGPPLGGPLFFSHYSFLGIDPNDLTDAYADYEIQTKNHTLINNAYCKANPKNYFGYSDSVWGLTASDIENGYKASSPTDDASFIAPTASLSSFPYTPTESMKALKFFYYVLGDRIWKDYGFVDAFSLHDPWFANSFLAIDQGPIMVMIENYRSGKLWSLFASCPEVKAGMQALSFNAPYL